MRTESKLGIVVAMVVVLVAGGYYMYRDREQQPIPMGDKKAEVPEANRPETNRPGASPAKSVGASKERVAEKMSAQDGEANRGTSRRGATPRTTRPRTSLADRNTNRQRMASRRPGQKPVARRNATTSQDTERVTRGSGRDAGPTDKPQEVAGRRDQRPGGAGRPETVARGPAHRNAGQADAVQPVRSGGNSDAEPAATSDRPATTGLATQPKPKLPPVSLADGSDESTKTGRRAIPLTARTPASAAAMEKHRVQPGDTLAGLAVQYYGSERFTQHLINANKHLENPNRLKIGDMVHIPAAPTEARRSVALEARRSAADVTSRGSSRTYTVRPGDSFYAIARDQLGAGSRWKELFELNRDVVGGEPTALKPGQILRLP